MNKFTLNMEDKIFDIAMYMLPSVIVGGAAVFMFKNFISSENNRRKYELLRENQKQGLPLRLQAYERMALFLERINPGKLVIRVAPISPTVKDYEAYLIQNIEQEFEHNLTQQIYITDEAWGMIVTAKNSIIQSVRNTSNENPSLSVEQFREKILSNELGKDSASFLALTYLKNEVTKFL